MTYKSEVYSSADSQGHQFHYLWASTKVKNRGLRILKVCVRCGCTNWLLLERSGWQEKNGKRTWRWGKSRGSVFLPFGKLPEMARTNLKPSPLTPCAGEGEAKGLLELHQKADELRQAQAAAAEAHDRESKAVKAIDDAAMALIEKTASAAAKSLRKVLP